MAPVRGVAGQVFVLDFLKSETDLYGQWKEYFDFSCERQCRKNFSPLQDEDGHFKGKAEMCSAFFASIFNTEDGQGMTQCPELEDHDKLPAGHCSLCGLVGFIQDHSKELADIVVRPLSMIFEWSWESAGIPVDWNLANVPIFKTGHKGGPGNYRPVSFTSVMGKSMEKIILEVIEKHLKDNAGIGQSQYEAS
ncbi:hypothetical protein WISP_134811 [Willisornis vidua]|uniref:Uncharacterized protein n=1 Tax=Willisornis vidua TaxID=1566151 RepID=A0ABQ9CUN2_9PASS|nr:hypothetical protein WISP_134811 [Willisornis vidua]